MDLFFAASDDVANIYGQDHELVDTEMLDNIPTPPLPVWPRSASGREPPLSEPQQQPSPAPRAPQQPAASEHVRTPGASTRPLGEPPDPPPPPLPTGCYYDPNPTPPHTHDDVWRLPLPPTPGSATPPELPAWRPDPSTRPDSPELPSTSESDCTTSRTSDASSIAPFYTPLRPDQVRGGPLRLLTLNARSLRCHDGGDYAIGLEQVLAAVSDLQPPAATMAIGLQETRWRGDVDDLLLTAWGPIRIITANSPQATQQGRHGVALILTGALARSKTTVTRPSPRLLTALLEPSIPGVPRLRVHVGYAPASDAHQTTDETYDTWLATLERTIAAAQTSAPWIPDFILADFNARVGQDSPLSGSDRPPPSAHGGYGHGTRNARGIEVLALAERLHLWLANTGFDVPEASRVTHVSNLPPPHQRESQIDYITCPRHWAKRCLHAQSRRECILQSDHFPVVADFKWRPPSRKPRRPRPPQIDWQRIRQLPEAARKTIQQEFFHKLDTVLADMSQATLDSATAMDGEWHRLVSGVNAAASAAMPHTTPRRQEARYMTDELKDILRRLRCISSLRCPTVTVGDRAIPRTSHMNYLKRQLSKGLRHASTQYIERQCARATQAIVRRDLKSVYKILRELTDTGKSAQHDYKTIPSEERDAHFRALFASPRAPADTELMQEMQARANPIKAEKWRQTIAGDPPTLAEVSAAIKRLNPGRAPGVEGLQAELLQYGEEVLTPKIQRLCAALWEHSHIPAGWAQSEILPLRKKGKPAESMDSYRPVSLVSLASKVLMLVLHTRLTPMIDDTVGEYQHGFRSTRSTTDAIHTLRLICEKYSQQQDRQLLVCFIDLTQAFDRVSWELLWHALRISGTPDPIIRVLRLFYEGIEMRVRTDPAEPDPGSFHPTAGVRQGCVLSPTLFILVFEYVIRVAMHGANRWPERSSWPILGNTPIPLLGYADDLALISRNLPALRQRMLRLEETCQRAGMRLSAKTKLMYINFPPSAPTPALQLKELRVDPVETFSYLGSEINTRLDLEATIRDRISKASAVFGMLRRIWDGKLPMRLKTRMYLSLVRPIALYGAETWTLLPSHERTLDAIEMRWLRQLLGVRLTDQIPNTEIRTNTRCPVSISEACRQYRLRYYGHLCRIPFRRTPKLALLQPVPGPRRQGRPPTTWYDLLARDAATRGLTRADLTGLSRDRDKYREDVVHGDRLDGLPTRTRPRPTDGR